MPSWLSKALMTSCWRATAYMPSCSESRLQREPRSPPLSRPPRRLHREADHRAHRRRGAAARRHQEREATRGHRRLPLRSHGRRDGVEVGGDCIVKLIIEPTDGVAPLLDAIKSAKRRVDIAVFRFDRTDVETALKSAAARGVKVTALI